jgi:dihydrofolate reductase
VEEPLMRKLVLMMSVSVDGFIEGPDREIDCHRVDDGLHRHFNEQLSTMGTFLTGRITYELIARFWPTADADPSSTGPMVESARIWRNMPKIVFSGTLERADWNTTVVRDVVPEEILALKAQPGRGSVARQGRSSPQPSCDTTWSTSTGSMSTRSSSEAASPCSRDMTPTSTPGSPRPGPSTTVVPLHYQRADLR